MSSKNFVTLSRLWNWVVQTTMTKPMPKVKVKTINTSNSHSRQFLFAAASLLPQVWTVLAMSVSHLKTFGVLLKTPFLKMIRIQTSYTMTSSVWRSDFLMSWIEGELLHSEGRVYVYPQERIDYKHCPDEIITACALIELQKAKKKRLGRYNGSGLLLGACFCEFCSMKCNLCRFSFVNTKCHLGNSIEFGKLQKFLCLLMMPTLKFTYYLRYMFI